MEFILALGSLCSAVNGWIAADKFRLVMNTVTGGSVLVIVLGIATFMIISGTRKLKRYEDLK